MHTELWTGQWKEYNNRKKGEREKKGRREERRTLGQKLRGNKNRRAEAGTGPETTLRELHARNRGDMEPRNAMWPSVNMSTNYSLYRTRTGGFSPRSLFKLFCCLFHSDLSSGASLLLIGTFPFFNMLLLLSKVSNYLKKFIFHKISFASRCSQKCAVELV